MIRNSSFPWRGLFLISALVAMLLGWRLWTVSKVLAEIYRYDCTVKAIDVNTFTPLRVIGINGPAMNPGDLIKQSFSSATTPEGALRLAGIGYEPRTFGIAVEGYSAREFTISSETQAEIEVLMTRLPRSR